MSKRRFSNLEPQLFTTGAFISPNEIELDSGKKVWVWVVDSFDGEIYDDEGTAIDGYKACADTADGLIEEE